MLRGSHTVNGMSHARTFTPVKCKRASHGMLGRTWDCFTSRETETRGLASVGPAPGGSASTGLNEASFDLVGNFNNIRVKSNLFVTLLKSHLKSIPFFFFFKFYISK